MKSQSAVQRLARGLMAAALAMLAQAAAAAIPPSERAALDAFYASTGGAGWTVNTGWGGTAGTECSWFGITCDAGGNTVQRLTLSGNHLVGTLPSLTALTGLVDFAVNDNQLTGTIPSLTGMTNLTRFYVDHNQLTGSVPILTGLTNLLLFVANDNQLSGTIPSLTGLTALYSLDLRNNRLTGNVPSLAGLSNLTYLLVSGNALSGTVPAVPNPNYLAAGGSALCPNNLALTADPAWDAATGQTPWYSACAPRTVPTVSQWSLALLAALLAVAVVGFRIRGETK